MKIVKYKQNIMIQIFWKKPTLIQFVMQFYKL